MKAFEASIAIRAYSERPRHQSLGSRIQPQGAGPSEWTLVFDCETTIDAAQQLRFGFFQVRKRERLEREGVFFDSKILTKAEKMRLDAYAKGRGLEAISVEEFRVEVFLKYGYTRRAMIVGFNLPFDISRIAVAHGPARRVMRGGFSFDLTGRNEDPRVRVKHLNPKAALIDFGVPGDQDAPRAWRTRKQRVPAYRGYFLDLKTLAYALSSRLFSLGSLAAYLKTATQKHETTEHGKVTKKYLDYGRADVQVTWECLQELTKRYATHGLSREPNKIISEAGIGKAYLQQMGIEPFLACVPTFSRSQFGEIMCAYYGGRAEVRNRRVVCEVLYCDFKSMYPTVNSLMGLWAFVIGDGMTSEDTTASTQAFLESVSLDDLQKPATWTRLCTLVRIKPQQDVLPVRCEYDEKSHTIGLNYLTSEESLWFTLADCIVSKLITGRCPRIDKARTFRPGKPQTGLSSVRILGRDDYAIDPLHDDFFTRLVDLRDEAKDRRDPAEKALKTIANSTSYGIFIEVNRDDAPKVEPLTVYGPHGKHINITTKALEDPGRYFNPILGVLITGAARLMLGIAEKVTSDKGLDWAFCDTDSLAMVRPKGMSRKEFHNRARKVIDWFKPLNPHRKPGSILKVENINGGIGSKKMEPLFCFAISAKRYALFNLDKCGRPVLRKASAHGLGHLMDPYAEADAPRRIPRPTVAVEEIGVRRWQYDLWYRIIRAAQRETPDEVPLDWHPALKKPAAMRYTASSPQLLNWVASWNDGRPYEEQIRPFAFLLSFIPKTGVFEPFQATTFDKVARGRPKKNGTWAPIAPFNTNPTRALARVFDRITGDTVDPSTLKTYADVLCQYHLSPEDKFANGSHLDRGHTERRHVIATGFDWIGKEANCIGDSGEADPHRPALEIYRHGQRT